jgi:hypothetical protein
MFSLSIYLIIAVTDFFFQADNDEANKTYIPHYANPEALGFVWIKPRPETFERCGKDITQFVYRGQGTNQLVGSL